MSLPPLMLAGISLHLQAGPAQLSEQAIGGETNVRLSRGRLVTMRHWEKMAGSITGSGFAPPGLDGLDFAAHHELRSTKSRALQSSGTAFTLPSDHRPDKAPWAFALVPGLKEPVETACVTSGRSVTVTPVPGATAYQVWFLPVYIVKCSRPSETQDSSGAAFGWTINWEEA